MNTQKPKPNKQHNQIINTYIDNDPILRNLRRNLIAWNNEQRAGIGHTAAGEIIYSIGRLLSKQSSNNHDPSHPAG